VILVADEPGESVKGKTGNKQKNNAGTTTMVIPASS